MYFKKTKNVNCKTKMAQSNELHCISKELKSHRAHSDTEPHATREQTACRTHVHYMSFMLASCKVVMVLLRFTGVGADQVLDGDGGPAARRRSFCRGRPVRRGASPGWGGGRGAHHKPQAR